MVKHKKASRIIASISVIAHGLMPVLVTAQNSINPMSRWDVDYNRAIIDGIILPEIDVNALPELADNGIKSGEAELNYLDSGQALVVDQQTARLLAYWNSFNIGANSTVQYNQSANDVALNIIQQQSPSQILGSLKCEAACWLINPNGIVFGENAQVDTRGLIAAAMEFNFNGLPLDGRDLTNEERERFRTESFYYQDPGDGSLGEAMLINAKALADGVSYTAEDIENLPRIIVKNGASIKSDGAPILLAGPEVINAGTVSSDNGQVILAGSRRDVYVALTNPDDKNYRGYLVEVDSGDRERDDQYKAPEDSEKVVRGAVTNLGTLSADFGNVTLVASDILQAGKIKSTTAVDVNGAVRLMARDRAQFVNVQPEGGAQPNRDAFYLENPSAGPLTNDGQRGNFVVGAEAGEVTLAADSAIEVSIDRSTDSEGNERVIAQGTDGFEQPRSQINIEGKTVVIEENSSITAPSAELTIRARENTTAVLVASETDSEASLEIKSGAVIDVSGTEDTQLSADRNTIDFFITSNELRDSPEQKNGVLLRQEVSIDVQRGTELFDWEVALDNIEKTANERAAQGGTIDILSKGQATIAENTVLDVSGGKVTYEEGFVDTTLLFTNRGLVDIADANPQDNFTGVLTNEQVVLDAKWGEIRSYRPGPSGSQRNFRDSYFEGAKAGSITIDAPVYFADSAQFLAGVSLGRFQQQPGAETPEAGSVFLKNNNQINFMQDIALVNQARSLAEQIDSQQLELSAQLIENSGAANVIIDTEGKLTQVSGADLGLTQGTSLDFTASDIDISGNIRTAGGDVTLTQMAANQTPGNELSISGSIDTSGNWTNLRSAIGSDTPTRIDAGDITVNAQDSLRITDTAKFKANAGALFTENNRLIIGKAGDVALSAKGIDQFNPAELIVDNPLDISALDGDAGGTFILKTDGNIALGDFGVSNFATNSLVDNQFFNETAVGAYDFTSNNGSITVRSDANIDLSHQSLIERDNVRGFASATDADQILQRAVLPDYLAAPGRLSLNALRIDNASNSVPDAGILRIENGATITGPAFSTVDLVAGNKGLIDGEITIAGGQLNGTLDGNTNTNVLPQDNYLLIGENASLDFSADAIDIPTAGAVTEKRLVGAGTITLNAANGYIIADEQANINLSGAVVESTQRVFSGDNVNGALQMVQTPLAAGSFSVRSDKGFDIASEINFGDSSQGYRGGLQSYELKQQSSDDDPLGSRDNLKIVLAENNIASAGDNLAFGDSIANEFISQGRVNTNNLNDTDTARLVIDVDNALSDLSFPTVLNSIEVVDSLDISASESLVLSTPNLVFSGENDSLLAIAPFVQLGEFGRSDEISRNDRFISTLANDSLQNSTGNLLVDSQLTRLDTIAIAADNIDIRAAQGVSVRAPILQGQPEGDASINIAAVGIDIDAPNEAFIGLKSNGDVTILSPVIWGETLASYQFDLVDEASRFELLNFGQMDSPLLSAGSTIGIKANNITIDSTIAAPYGVIDLDAGDSGTVNLTDNAKLTVAGQTDVPLGRVIAGDVRWSHIAGTLGGLEIKDLLPEKKISVSGSTINSADGSEIDLAGGGNIYGREFVAGLGGSRDILANQFYQNQFAIIPTHQSGLSPFDPNEFAGSGIPEGTLIEINGSSQIADGTYTVLPANYALLPGALLMTSEPLSATIDSGYRDTNRFGAEVVSGRFSALGLSQNQPQNNWSGFRIEPGSVVNQRADYRITRADAAGTLLNDQPGIRPKDNGRLTLSATDILDWNGSVNSSDSSPVGVSFDITSSNNIIIGDAESDTALVVAPELFSSIDADSILIGGERQWSSENNAWQVNSQANSVSFDGASITGQEIVVTANDVTNSADVVDIELKNNAQINTTAAPSFAGNRWVTPNNGSTLLASTTSGSQLINTNTDNLDGSIAIADNSEVRAGGAIGIAYDGVASLEQLFLEGQGDKRLQVASGNGLIVGDTTAGAQLDTTLFESAQLTSLQADDALSFNQSIAANLVDLSIQADNIVLEDGANVAITASERIALIGGSPNSSTAPTVADNSSLQLLAPQLLISNASSNASTDNNRSDNQRVPYYLSSNAASTVLQGTESITVSGTVNLATAGDLLLDTSQLQTQGIGDFTADAQGQIEIISSNGSVNRATATHGIFNFIAASDITIDTAISAQSGLIAAQSTAGSVSISDNAYLDVSPYSVTFPDQVRTADTGIISLQAANSLSVSDPRAFVFGGEQESGQGGVLELLAGGELSLTGTDYDGSVGQWSGGGLDLTLQADSISGGLREVLSLNSQGFNGDLDVLITGADQNLLLENNQSLQANNLRLATLQGQTIINGNIDINDATENVIVHGGAGVTINDTATISVESDNNVTTSIESPNNGVVIAQGATLNLESDLNIVSSLTVLQTRPDSTNVILDTNDSIGGDVSLVANRSETMTSLDQTALTTAVTALISDINNLTITDFIQTTDATYLKPQLDIVADSNLTVAGDLNLTANNFYLDNGTADTTDDISGILQLRAQDSIILNGDINAATDLLDLSSTGLNNSAELLLNKDSWSVNLAAGNSTTHHYSYTDFRLLNEQTGHIELNNADIKTGTGDITLFANDLMLADKSFIGSLGKTDYSANSIALLGRAELPAWGDNEYASVWAALPQFSGFSRGAGDINIDLSGDLQLETSIGTIVDQTPASFIQRIANDSLILGETNPSTLIPGGSVNYEGIRLWALAANAIEGGIHSVGGGDVRVSTKGDIHNLGFSTPGVGFNPTKDAPIQRTQGGELSVASRGNITHTSFANDGSTIDVRALKSIADDSVNPGSTLFIGSDTDIHVAAGTGLTFGPVLNTFTLPQSSQQERVNFLRGGVPFFLFPAADVTAQAYYDGFDNSSILFATTTGDLVRDVNNEDVDSFIRYLDFTDPRNPNVSIVSGLIANFNDLRLGLLPSQVNLESLSGNIALATRAPNSENTLTGNLNVTLFPSEQANLTLASGQNILGLKNETDSVKVTISDVNAADLPNRDTDLIVESSGSFIDKIEEEFLLGSQFERNDTSREPPDRQGSGVVGLHALGNIGRDDQSLTFKVPKEIIANAGNDIVNTNFTIEHGQQGDISQIAAGNDIRYTLNVSAAGTLLTATESQESGISLAGPGDLLVSAGGDINLAASNGIRSVANADLPDAVGGNVHVFAGFNQVGDYKALVGNGVADNRAIIALSDLSADTTTIDNFSFIGWFAEQAAVAQADTPIANAMMTNISRATGRRYDTLQLAVDDWESLNSQLQSRIAVSSMKQVALAQPEFLVNNGDILFANPGLGEEGFGSQEERQQAFNDYWNGIGSLVALEYLLTPDRQADLMAGLSSGSDLSSFANQSISSQLNTAVAVFDGADKTRQQLIAQQVMLEHTKQSGVESSQAGNTLVKFERGFVAQRQFFGSDYDATIAGIVREAQQSGAVFGSLEGTELSSIDQVLQAWTNDSGTNFSFDPNAAATGNIDLVFSRILTREGGDLNIITPSGSVNVGLAAAQLNALVPSLSTDDSLLPFGVIAEGLGDVNGIVGDQFNVNESRTFSLAGGELSLWSAFGDIDAGRGAKTAFSLPEPNFDINPNTGSIIVERPPAIGGSGIRTSGSRSASDEELTNEQRFDRVAAGAGSIFLSTPLGVVDAGEAGIQSAGDLFIAATEVRGADNINVGGVSVGVATDTTVDVNVTSVGNAASAATEAAQSGVTDAASNTDQGSATAFITIELLDTGT